MKTSRGSGLLVIARVASLVHFISYFWMPDRSGFAMPQVRNHNVLNELRMDCLVADLSLGSISDLTEVQDIES
jgi:hypothetical protein